MKEEPRKGLFKTQLNDNLKLLFAMYFRQKSFVTLAKRLNSVEYSRCKLTNNRVLPSALFCKKINTHANIGINV